MYNKLYVFLLTGLVWSLTACSGGGGNGGTPADSSNITTNNNSVSETTSNNRGTAITGNNGGTPTADNDNTVNPTIPDATSATSDWFKSSPELATLSYDKFKVKPVADNLAAEVQKVVENTNKLRAEKGLAPLRYDESLSAYAQRRAEQIVGRFSHTLPDSHLLTTEEVNAGENIAAGSDNADDTVLQWRNSESHYRNIIAGHYETIGIGVVYVPGSELTYYWAQIFGHKDTVSNYYFDSSPSAKQNPLVDATAKSSQALPATNWLRVDGVDISLHHVTGDGNWYDINRGNYSGIVNGYADTRFGIVKNGTDEYKAFYHGNNTDYDNMPQTGSAIYTGKAVISDGNSVNNNVEAHIKADFSAKQLNGALVENNTKLIGIHANIRGSSFYSPEGAPVATQGGFFGNNAEEVGGVFYEQSTARRGAFAAKK